MNVEHELRRALEPAAAPPGFAERVRARVAATPSGTSLTTVRRWRLPLAMAASLTLAIATSALWLRQKQQDEGQHARDQLLLALRVASVELKQVEARLAAR